MRHLIVVVMIASACALEPAPAIERVERPTKTAALSTPTAVDLDDARYLRRLSYALRAKQPSLEDYQALEDATDKAVFFSDIVDVYLEDPGFGETMVELHNDAYQLDVGTNVFVGVQKNPNAVPDSEGRYHFSDWFTVDELSHSIMRAPLELIRHVIENNRDYRDIVTTSDVVADEVTARVWSIENYDPSGDKWQELAYPAGQTREAAGILSDNALYLRHQSAGFNYNRGRANALANALVCRDFLDSDVPVTDIDLSDEEAVRTALSTNTQCVACHQGVDAIARNFDAFRGSPNPALLRADNEESYPWYFGANAFASRAQQTGRDPAWFGAPTTSLADLGQKIADDPRFSRCTAKRFVAHFHQVKVDDVPFDVAADMQSVFETNYSAKALAKAVVLHPAFRKGSDTEDNAFSPVGLKRARPPQLGRMYADLTLFNWRGISISPWPAARFDEGTNQLVPVVFQPGAFYFIDVNYWTNGPLGYRVLGGGIDSVTTTTPIDTTNPTSAMVITRAAKDQAFQVVSLDIAWPSLPPQLIDPVTALDEDEQRLRDMIVDLNLRLYGERVSSSSTEVDELVALFNAATPSSADEMSVDLWFYENDETRDIIRSLPRTQGLIAMLSAMFADPRILHY